ncbi:MAG: ATP-binding protein [Pseudomonadota bacterium]
MKRVSLKRVLLVVSLAGLVPMLIPLGMLITRGHDMAREEAIADLRLRTYALAAQYSMAFSALESTVAELGAETALSNTDQAACSEWLQNSWPEHAYVHAAMRLNAAGAVTCASQAELNARSFDLTFNPTSALSYNEASVLRVDLPSGKSAIAVSRVFWNDGAPFRVAVALDPDWLRAGFTKVENDDGERLLIIDKAGKILALFPEQTEWIGKRVPVFKRIAAPREDPVIHSIETGLNQDPRTSSSITLHDFSGGAKLYMSLTASTPQLFSKASSLTAFGVFALILALVGIVSVQWLLFSWYLTKPIGRILQYTQALANGADPRAPMVDDNAPKEYLAIAEATRSMAAENEDRSNALTEALHNLERAEEAARLGHWRLDFKSETLFWSDGVYRLHGYMPDAFQPTLENALDHYHPEDRASMESMVEDAVATGEGFDTVKRIIRADGKPLYVRSRGIVMYDRHAEPLSVFGIIIDVDAPKRSVRALERAQFAAQTLADTRAKLLTTVSHEIKAPVGAMLEICRTLKTCEDAPMRDEYLDLVDATGQMLLSVIGDLLDGSMVSGGRLRLKPRQVELWPFLEKCYDVFRIANPDRAAAFSIELGPDLPTHVTFDPQRTRQILFNLLSNAFKHTVDGKIVLRAERQDDGLSLSVEDEGPGLSDEAQANIFTPYVHTDKTDRNVDATGLGLSIVKTLAEHMGATVSVASKLGMGARFTLRFPAAFNEPAHGAKDTARSLSSQANVSRPVLITEDNPVNQKLMTAFLSKHGVPYVLQNDGQSAMEWLLSLDPADESSIPCLALIDVNMPRLNGIELSEFIRQQWTGPSDLPIYLVTADMLSEHEHAMEHLGIDGHISKPIDFEILREVLRTHAIKTQKAA